MISSIINKINNDFFQLYKKVLFKTRMKLCIVNIEYRKTVQNNKRHLLTRTMSNIFYEKIP